MSVFDCFRLSTRRGAIILCCVLCVVGVSALIFLGRRSQVEKNDQRLLYPGGTSRNASSDGSESTSSVDRHAFVTYLLDQRSWHFPALATARNDPPSSPPPNLGAPVILSTHRDRGGYGFGNRLFSVLDSLLYAALSPRLLPAPIIEMTHGHSTIAFETKTPDSGVVVAEGVMGDYFEVRDPELRKSFYFDDLLNSNVISKKKVLECLDRNNDPTSHDRNVVTPWNLYARNVVGWGKCAETCQSLFSHQGLREVYEGRSEIDIETLVPDLLTAPKQELQCVHNPLVYSKFIHATCDRARMERFCELGLCSGIAPYLEYHLSKECTGVVDGFHPPQPDGFQYIGYRLLGNVWNALFQLHSRILPRFELDFLSKVAGPMVVVQMRWEWKQLDDGKPGVHRIAPEKCFLNCFKHVVESVEEIQETDELTLYLASDTPLSKKFQESFSRVVAGLGKTVHVLTKEVYLTQRELQLISNPSRFKKEDPKAFKKAHDLSIAFDFSILNRAEVAIVTYSSTWGTLGTSPSHSFPPYAVVDPRQPFAGGEGEKCYRPRIFVSGNLQDESFKGPPDGVWQFEVESLFDKT